MGLRYLLDGYNIVRHEAFQKYRRPPDAGIVELRRLLDRYRPQGRNRVTIVLDGYPPAGGLQQEDDVIYARSSTADAAIIRMVRSSPHPGSVRVVTDDRLLQREVRAAGAAWIGVEEFLSACDPDEPENAATADDREPVYETGEDRRINEELARIWDTDDPDPRRKRST